MAIDNHPNGGFWHILLPILAIVSTVVQWG